jgi:hypothetical protein
LIVDDAGQAVGEIAVRSLCALTQFNLRALGEALDDCLGYKVPFVNDNYSGHRLSGLQSTGLSRAPMKA